MNTTVSILVEIPEDLHESVVDFLEHRPDWERDRLFSAALSLFLLQQNGFGSVPERSVNYRRTARIYLDSLFKQAV